MAEESSHVIRGINWRETFPFTHLFRTFRIAIHPSKLFLALAALLALYMGGRILDTIWRPAHRALPGEIEQFESGFYAGRQARPTEWALERVPGADGDAMRRYAASRRLPLAEWRKTERAEAQQEYARLLRELAVLHTKGGDYAKLWDPKEAEARAKAADYTDDVEYALAQRRDKAVEDARGAYKDAPKKDDTQADAAQAQLRASVQGAFAQYARDMRTVDALEGVGLFDAFLRYQTKQINSTVLGVTRGNWLTDDGVVWSVIRFFTVAPAWALSHHWLYFLLFGTLFMVVWSTFGGAISRIAAVHVADEGRKLSIRQGLSFSISKFLSFLSAPLIPLAIVLVIGLALALAGWLAFLLRLNIVVGVFFVIALAAGIVMTLVLLGTFGGFGLMYPTIAVEGSDSFDAISRSFSYVYAKPWRMLFYSLVAIAYGALTYLFVRLFIWLTLALTHFFVGLWVLRDAVEGVGLWNAMFPPPEFLDLPYSINFAYLTTYSSATAFFIAFWNYLLIAMLGAFAISFYFSANTIIYYLMRREVDATEMDDVYLEQPEEDFVETPTSPTSPITPITPTASAAEPAPATTIPPADTEPRPE